MSFTDFGWALMLLRAGKKVARRGWNGKGLWVFLKEGDEGKVNAVRPYLMIKSIDNYFVPWAPSQTDVLAEDWEEVES